MAFLSGVSLPGGGSIATTPGAPPPTGGGFLGSIQMPTATSQAASAKSAQIASLASAAQVAQANAKYANSFPGIAWNTAKGIWTNILKPTVNEFGDAVKADVAPITQQFEQGLQQSENQPRTPEGALSSLSGSASMLSAPIAPYFKFFGAGMNALGQDPYISGNPSLQKFALSPAGQTTIRVAQDFANAANIASTAGLVIAPFTAKPGGFLDTAKTPSGEDVVPKTEPQTAEEAQTKGVPVKTAAQFHTEYARSQGYEPYTPNEKLPTIQMGEKAKSNLPTIQANPPASNDLGGGLKLVPEAPTTAPVAPETAPTDVSSPETQNSTFYHGTSVEGDFKLSNNQPTYLVKDQKIANGFANDVMYGSQQGGLGRVVDIAQTGAGKAKTIDIPKDIGYGIKDYVANAVAQAKTEGYRYVDFTHPAIEMNQADFPVRVSIYPAEDLKTIPSTVETPKPLTPAESTGKVEQSTLASKVDANAVARKLTDSLGDLPEYNKVNMKEQAQFASDLVENEPDKAMRIAMGEEPPPPHILPEAVFTALEDKATRAGDVNTLRQLGTKSNLSLQATAMGQRIRALGERDSLSPTGKIREVAESRASRATPDKIKGAVDSIKGEIKKARTTSREDWSSFVQRITCNS